MPRFRRGSGGTYRRGKTWWITYMFDGKRVRESAGTKDAAEARRVLQLRLGQAAEGRLVVGVDRVTFQTLAEDFLADYRANRRRTVGDAERRVRKHLAPFFHDRPAHRISTADVNAYVVRRQGEGATNGGINRELACLKRMFTLGLQANKIARRPHIPHLKESPPRSGFFERSELQRLLPHLPDWLRGPICFAFDTGWRLRSEVFPLTWDRVDLDAGTVRLDAGTTKNDDSRLVYLTDELVALIRVQWEDHGRRHPECPFVFHRDGHRIRQPLESWRKACRAAGLPGKLMHDLRRTAVRNMVRAGIPERVAMQISGHRTRSVFDRYHIVAETDLQEAAKRLSRAQRDSMTAGTVTSSVTTGVDNTPGELLTH